VERLPGFADGWFAVQDESAMQAARLLAPAPGSTVLDLCAAPGTKTTHLAELMGNRGSILAADVDRRRLALVEENCRRLGIDIVETQVVAADARDVSPGPFDSVLLDVPCSNTGVLGKRPEARWRLRPQDIEELAAIQKRLLTAAIARLKPGGRLVYSTCSIEPEENEGVVRAALSAFPNLRLLSEVHREPGQPADGAYQAVLGVG
jgi:16S rRNA (cytosine967-C5)-methyltransferase